MSPGRQLTLRPKAERDLRRAPRAQQTAIAAHLAELAQGALNLDIKALKGHSGWYRSRVGDWRVLFFHPQHELLIVERIVNRRDLEKAVRDL